MHRRFRVQSDLIDEWRERERTRLLRVDGADVVRSRDRILGNRMTQSTIALTIDHPSWQDYVSASPLAADRPRSFTPRCAQSPDKAKRRAWLGALLLLENENPIELPFPVGF